MLRITSAIALLLSFAMCALGGDLVPPSDLDGRYSEPEESAELAATVLHYLNETSARRRLTTVFPNEQSPFFGVQINHVNVGAGNLTFLFRDMVRLDRVPIVFGRIYDSRKRDESDFGPGWKLSVAEYLRPLGDHVMYVDASNSEYSLQTDGSRIWSRFPHLTGIDSGHISTTQVVLQVGDLTKTFMRLNDRYNLVEVRDRLGNWIRTSYSRGVIDKIESSHGRYVELRRDQRQRIISATDDVGRTVAYTYDSEDRLVEHADLAGERFRYTYDAAGYLSRMVDPRGVDALAARFDEAGRVVRLSSQHDEMTFDYGNRNVAVTNASQQGARFWQNERGLTEGVQDFAGGISLLEFDRDLHVRQMSFNGVITARAEYVDARLSILRTQEKASIETARFAYDARGRLVGVNRGARAVRRYAYDVLGRVVFASDGLGERRYSYTPTGTLAIADLGGFRLGIRANVLGLAEHVSWNPTSSSSDKSSHAHATVPLSTQRVEQNGGDLSLDITYDATDRVESTRFGVRDGSFGSNYGYSPRGFRISGQYDLLKRRRQGDVSLTYDSVGNLREWTYPGRSGLQDVIRHTVGPHNQVFAVTPIGHEEFEQRLDYDASGRVIRLVQGNDREARFAYDDVGRLTDVFLDGEHVLTARHEPMDVDPVHDADSHTAFTAVRAPIASSVFGSLDEIAYARSIGTPYGFLRFSPTMARFVVNSQTITEPDSVTLASLKRRNLASSMVLSPTPLLGFDKPSNSLFIPAEYFSVNCAICYGGAYGFSLGRSGSGMITIGQTVNFVADAVTSYCYQNYNYEDTGPYSEPKPWLHQIYVNGAYNTTLSAPYGYETDEYLAFGLSFGTSGTKTIRDELLCGCLSMFSTSAEANIDVYYVVDIAGELH